MNKTANASHESAPSDRISIGQPSAQSEKVPLPSPVLALSAEESRRIHELAAALGRGNDVDGEFWRSASLAAGGLPRRVRAFLLEMRNSETCPIALVRGNRVEKSLLGPTPRSWADDREPSSKVYETLLILYAAMLGDVIGWKGQQGGKLVADIVPTPGQEDSMVSSSSRKELTLHTEDAFSPHRADWVVLLALRNPSGAPTTVSSIRLAAMPDTIKDVLSSDRFLFSADDSHEGARRPERLAAVLGGAERAPTLRYDEATYLKAEPGDEDGGQALQWLHKHLAERAREIMLKPGDVAVIDNRTAVHGRRSFVADRDGQDRWLKRVSVVADLRRTIGGRSSATSRVIESE